MVDGDAYAFETILQRMLDRVPDGIDKRPGSIIYDALAPEAAELAQSYIELNNVLKLGFAHSSNGTWLEQRTAEQGIYRRPAVKAIREAVFNLEVSEGVRFFVDDLYFTVIEAGTTARVECEEAGTVGNEPAAGSALLPVETIPGLTSAVLGDVLVPGEERESDASLLERYRERINEPSTSNNQAQLKQWAKEVEGVGDAKVFPLWNGDLTAKVVIMDSARSPASPELVAEVQDYIDPGASGLGEGKAAIGLFCTVESCTGHPIDVSAVITTSEGKTLADAQAEVEAGLDEYFRSIAFQETVVRYAQIGAILLNAPSVVDYENLLVNGGTANVVLTEEEIPVRGTVTLN